MKDLKPLLNKLIAHRGIHNKYIKGNSLVAIDMSIMKNYPVEFDVTLTKDNVVILCHDNFIKCGNKNFIISNHRYEELKNVCHELVTLEEVLKLVSGKVPLLIEIKPYTKGNKIEKEVVKLLDGYNGYFAIQSFSPFIIYWFKKNRPNYIRGQLLTNTYNYNSIVNGIYKYMLFNKFTNPDFICYNIKGLPNKQIKKVRKTKPIIGWTIKKESQIKKYNNYCDNFICDNILEIRK